MRKPCVPGSFLPAHAREPGNETKLIPYEIFTSINFHESPTNMVRGYHTYEVMWVIVREELAKRSKLTPIYSGGDGRQGS